MDTDVHLCLVPGILALSTPVVALLLALFFMLVLAAGVIAYSSVPEFQHRPSGEPGSRRVLFAALVAAILAMICGYYGWHGLFAIEMAEAWEALELYVPGHARQQDIFARAIACGASVSVVFLAYALGLNGGRSAKPGKESPLRVIGGLLADLFAWWVPKQKPAKPAANGEVDFEITMAGGEEVEEEEREYIENILELGDTIAQEVMTPRTDVVGIDISWEPKEILQAVADARHSRFPVFEDNLDTVLGVLHLRDLVEYLARGEGVSQLDLRSILHDANFVPASKKIDDVLRDLQRQKGHMAVVLDEYGGTAGILTIEDLLEEIVGEIQDEYDEESRIIHQTEDGSWLISAQALLSEVNEELGTSLHAEDVDTLGGYITQALGHIPDKRESFEDEAAVFTVLSVEKNRIGRVKVELLQPN